MPTILFVHGTGVRAEGYERTLASISSWVEKTPEMKPFQLGRCLWGESHGSRLIEGGRTIPGYNQSNLDEAEREILLKWWLLCQDPGYQIDRLWEDRCQKLTQLDRTSWLQKHESIANYHPSKETSRHLVECQSIDFWADAFSAITSRRQWREAAPSKHGGTPNNFYPKFARCTAEAIVAELMLAGFNAGVPAMNWDQRDALVESILDDLNARFQGVFDWIKSIASNVSLMAYAAGDHLISGISPRPALRKWVTSNSIDKFGDILYYQAHGQRIRDFIGRRIEASAPPVIVLAHSLGGIASVELLVQRDLSNCVKALITVGSQSPIFHEMNCLKTLERTLECPNPTLPAHFPPWLNIYDPNDYLSYAAAPVFGDTRVTDCKILSRQPRLMAHSTYLNHPEVWCAIAEFVGNHAKIKGE